MDDNGSGSPNTKKKWRDSKTAGALSAAGSSLSSSGSQMTDDARYEEASRIGPVAYKRGGKVRKTGPAIVHRGERVIPKKKVKRVEKMMRKAKMRMKART
jgi:hypothetical protein